jgi:hypothetical protein
MKKPKATSFALKWFAFLPRCEMSKSAKKKKEQQRPSLLSAIFGDEVE